MHRQFAARSDSTGFRSVYAAAGSGEEWLTPTLWTGAVPVLGAPAIALLAPIKRWRRRSWATGDVGVTQFLLVGWPDVEEMQHFAAGVVPLLGDAARDPHEGSRQPAPAADSA